jgi:hypothetical protein
MTEPSSSSPTAPLSDAELLRLAGKLREVGQELDRRFLDKGELVRLMLISLFSQLRNLQDIKVALSAMANENAQKLVGEVDKLLEGIFESSRWNG